MLVQSISIIDDAQSQHRLGIEVVQFRAHTQILIRRDLLSYADTQMR